MPARQPSSKLLPSSRYDARQQRDREAEPIRRKGLMMFSRSMLVPLVRTAAASGAVAMLGLGLAATANAGVGCTYAGAPQHAVTLMVSGKSDAIVERRGDEVVVLDGKRAPAACAGGVPTVLNTDTIHVVFSKSDNRTVEMRLAGGPFAPGVTPEADGAPEIEIDVRGESGLSLDVIGTAGPDQLRWVAAGDAAGLNLNPQAPGDHDADVMSAPGPDEIDTLLVADGAGGDDTIIADPSAPGTGDAFAVGGSGDDVLGAFGDGSSYLLGDSGDDIIAGGPGGDVLEGEDGSDRISGKGGADKIHGGPGADRLDGGAGRDVIGARDFSRDNVTCGTGRDRVDTDRRDLVRGCERIRRR
jgi:Ca2+-binding RTX toxin-like protein